MRTKAYHGSIEPLHFENIDDYQTFIKSARRIMNAYGFITYADILSLIRDNLVACDDDRIFWPSMGLWVESFEHTGCGTRVHIELKHPQYIIDESDCPTYKCPFCCTYTDGTERIKSRRGRYQNFIDRDSLLSGRCHCSPGNFFDYIRMNVARDNWWQYTFIIMGKPGPTGKTHLCNNLNKAGFKAFEVSEHLPGVVEYLDNENHYLVDEMRKTVTIILNRKV